MNYGRLVFAVSVLGLAACAPQKQNGTLKASASSNLVEPVGMFKKEIKLGSFLEKKFLTIDSASVTATTICNIMGEKIKVEVSSPAQVSSSHFNVLSSAKKTESLANVPCTAELKSGVVAYEVQGDELYIAEEGKESGFFGYRAGKRPSTMQQVKANLAAAGNKLEQGNQWLNKKGSDFAAKYNEANEATREYTTNLAISAKNGVKEVYQTLDGDVDGHSAFIGTKVTPVVSAMKSIYAKLDGDVGGSSAAISAAVNGTHSPLIGSAVTKLNGSSSAMIGSAVTSGSANSAGLVGETVTKISAGAKAYSKAIVNTLGQEGMQQ